MDPLDPPPGSVDAEDEGTEAPDDLGAVVVTDPPTEDIDPEAEERP